MINSAEYRSVTVMQTQVLIHLAGADPSLPVPRVHATLAGAPSKVVTEPSGKVHVVPAIFLAPSWQARQPHRGCTTGCRLLARG